MPIPQKYGLRIFLVAILVFSFYAGVFSADGPINSGAAILFGICGVLTMMSFVCFSRAMYGLSVALVLALSCPATVDAQVIHLHHTVKAEGCRQVVLGFTPDEVEVRFTAGSRIMIELTIATNMDSNVCDLLSKAGRYNVLTTMEEALSLCTISLPSLGKAVIVRGVDLDETIKVVIYLPGGVDLLKPVAAN